MTNTEKIDDILATITRPEEALGLLKAVRNKFDLIGTDLSFDEIEQIHKQHLHLRQFNPEESDRADDLNLVLQDLTPGIVNEITTTSRRSIEAAMSKCGKLATINANRSVHDVISDPAAGTPFVTALTAVDPLSGSPVMLFTQEFEDLLEAHHWGKISRGRSVGELRADGWTTEQNFRDAVIVTGHTIRVTGDNGRTVELASC